MSSEAIRDVAAIVLFLCAVYALHAINESRRERNKESRSWLKHIRGRS